MITLRNGENKEMRLTAALDGINILSHVINDAVNTPNTQPDYTAVDMTLTAIHDGKSDTVYTGKLSTFVQSMLMNAYDTTFRSEFVNAEIGVEINAAAASVYNYHVADLSVYFPEGYAESEFVLKLRAGQIFPSGETNNSYIMFDFNQSDDAPTRRFKMDVNPVEVASVKSLQLNGVISFVGWIQSDSQYIETNDAQYNSTNIHPVEIVTCSSPYFNSLTRGVEFQLMDCDNLNGVIDLTNSKKLRLQKSLHLTDRDYLTNPKFDLQLNSGSMSSSIAYNIVSIEVLAR